MTLENQNYTSIIGNPNMPYLNSLLDQGALLTNFYANFHPSQPNYFALTTGQSFYTKEGPIPTGTNHVVNALATKNKTWKGYYADVTTHEAVFRYFPEIWQNPAQLAKIVPIFPDFMRDVTTGSLPSYSIIHDLPDDQWPQLYRMAACAWDRWTTASGTPLPPTSTIPHSLRITIC